MKILEFISAISIMTLVFGYLINLILGIPIGFAMAIKENEKTLFWAKAIIRILITSIIANYLLNFTGGQSTIYSIVFYILGFYCYLVLFTLTDETEKEAVQENQRNYSDYIFLKATSLNPLLILVALSYFIVALIFPSLTNLYLPNVCLRIYNWAIVSNSYIG